MADGYLDSGVDSTGKGGGASGGGGGFLSFLGSNPGLSAGLVGGAAALLPSLFSNNSAPFTQQIQDVIGREGSLGAQAGGEAAGLYGPGSNLVSALTTGQLPPGAQAEVDLQVNKQIADTKAKYAQLGQTGSTMEQSALNDIQTRKSALSFQIAQQMAQTGLQSISQSLQALNIAGQADSSQASAYEALMKAQMGQNKDLFSSIGNFASAFAKALPAVAAAA